MLLFRVPVADSRFRPLPNVTQDSVPHTVNIGFFAPSLVPTTNATFSASGCGRDLSDDTLFGTDTVLAANSSFENRSWGRVILCSIRYPTGQTVNCRYIMYRNHRGISP